MGGGRYWASSNFQIEYYRGETGQRFNSNAYIRCVKGDAPPSSFTNNGNGTITDSTASLMWEEDIYF